jgi:hypothetical protein
MTAVKQEAAADGSQAAAPQKGPVAGVKMWRPTLWEYMGRETWCRKAVICTDVTDCHSGVVVVYGSGKARIWDGLVAMCIKKGERLVVGYVSHKKPGKTFLGALTIYEARDDGVYFVEWLVDDGMTADEMYMEIKHGFETLRSMGLCKRRDLAKWLESVSDLLIEDRYRDLRERLEEC